ncbi:hypothetical protein PLEI_2957 [Photobacterium leiognathi lrivu.4.1]|uniref:Uncharacterized protein n=1 Tax=Photobacterium leiognathi lrivu.4.1 TaxID=1248232 RepID=V5F7M2_PHOLE|nr:hypothetical protein [Photobacterium leiognathi]GAD31299.1 hypothetical protein PLEI_2957 [Photobacterium leiognathi lrivu.4.1]
MKKSLLALLCLSAVSAQAMASTHKTFEEDLINATAFNAGGVAGETADLPSSMRGDDDSVLLSALYQTVRLSNTDFNLDKIPTGSTFDITLNGHVNKHEPRQVRFQLMSSQAESDVPMFSKPLYCNEAENTCSASLVMTDEMKQYASQLDKIVIASDADIAQGPVDMKSIHISYEAEDSFSVSIDENLDIVANMTNDIYKNKDGYALYLNGSYLGEKAQGLDNKFYYTAHNKGERFTQMWISRDIKKGDVITLARVPEGKSALDTDYTTELARLEVKDLDKTVDKNFYNISATKDDNGISVRMPKSVFEGKRRVVFFDGNDYIGETFNGTGYYTSKPIEDNDFFTFKVSPKKSSIENLRAVYTGGTPGLDTIPLAQENIKL